MIQDVFFWALVGVTALIYWLIPFKLRTYFLSAVSLAAIVLYDPVSAAFIVAMSVPLYFALPIIARRDRSAEFALLLAILGLALPLVFLKIASAYGGTGALLPALLVPLGMSYYVFRLISVAIDVCRTGDPPQSARKFFEYVFLFTIFAAGPIQRYGPYAEQEPDRFHVTYLTEGAMRIATGLVKLTVLVDLILYIRNWLLVWEAPIGATDKLPTLTGVELWVLLVATYLTSYLNLSAYTDIALGTSRLLGFRIMENFDYPIIARSLDDYWRRWHISLTSWCQTYVYSIIVGWLRNPYIAVIAAFQVMGLWHVMTLNRVAWGLFQAAGIIVVFAWRRLRRRGPRQAGRHSVDVLKGLAGWLTTQAFVTAGFMFVVNERSNDVLGSLILLTRLVGM